MFRDLFQTTGLTLERLHSFLMVAEAGGVTKAAGGDPNRQSLFSRQIKELEEFFGVGRLHVNRRHDNHREHLCQYAVTKRDHLVGTIIPFFRDFPLRTSKRFDFEGFAACMDVIESGRRLTRDGLMEIARVTETMNHKKPRHELIRILRGHTPDIQVTG